MPVLLDVVVLETLGLPVVVFVDWEDSVNCGLEEDVLLTVELRVDVSVLVVVFVEVPDNVAKFVALGD